MKSTLGAFFISNKKKSSVFLQSFACACHHCPLALGPKDKNLFFQFSSCCQLSVFQFFAQPSFFTALLQINLTITAAAFSCRQASILASPQPLADHSNFALTGSFSTSRPSLSDDSLTTHLNRTRYLLSPQYPGELSTFVSLQFYLLP